MQEAFLRLLQDAEEGCSAATIGYHLGISEEEAESQIEKLKETGYEIEKTHLGYRLKKGYLDARVISNLLSRKREVYVTPCTSSTNDWAAEMSGQAENGSLFLAERQTKGRGRRGRQWESPFGEGLFFSLLEYPKLPPEEVAKLTLCAGLAVCRGIEEVTGLPPQIKWPNDIVLKGKKVCGILTEMRAEGEKMTHVIVGIGVNVNQSRFPEELEQIATSLKLITGKEWDKNVLVAAICNHMEQYEQLLREKQFPMEEYRKCCATLGREVRVIQVGGEFLATALTVTEEGELLVALQSGEERLITSGEVSVRGMLGYV